MRKKEVVVEEKVNRFETAVRYFPDSKHGLTAEQVQQRNAENLTNVSNIKTSKSIGSILFKNIFTFFNIICGEPCCLLAYS